MTAAELKRLRMAAGLTQRELARLLCRHPITVAKWESDSPRTRRKISAATADHIRGKLANL